MHLPSLFFHHIQFGFNNIDVNLQYNSPDPNAITVYQNYKSKFVHIALGTADSLSMTTACGALVQGSTHYNRGRIYQAYLTLLGYSPLHTVDYIRGIGHVDSQMFAVSIDRYLFYKHTISLIE
jgi:hypothetical protein